jgi:hypothetical protein
MKNLEDLIAMATRHVDEGRRIVAEQRKRVADNNAGPDAAGLLQTFERSLEIRVRPRRPSQGARRKIGTLGTARLPIRLFGRHREVPQ